MSTVVCGRCGREFATDGSFEHHDCPALEDDDEGGLPFETPEEFAALDPFDVEDLEAETDPHAWSATTLTVNGRDVSTAGNDVDIKWT